MITITDLENALKENEKRLADIEAENRVFLRLIEIENAKEIEQVDEDECADETNYEENI